MRNFFYIFIPLISVFAVSCGDEINNGWLYPQYRTYNKNDSAAFCDVIKEILGPDTKEYKGLKLDDIQTWDNDKHDKVRVRWKYYDDIKEYRISMIFLNRLIPSVKSNHLSRLSSRIWDIDSLRYFHITECPVNGELPTPDIKKSKVEWIIITSTKLTDIPLEIFQMPNLDEFNLSYTPSFTKMPPGFESLPPDNKDKRTSYIFRYNGLNGKVPVNPNISVDFTGNMFEYIDWNEWEKVDFSTYFLLYCGQSLPGPYVRNNLIKCDMPERLRSDTLAMLYTDYMACDQKCGYGIKGMWGSDKISTAREQYLKNHPELKCNSN